jgi:iron(III) transport system substrate-binding protein
MRLLAAGVALLAVATTAQPALAAGAGSKKPSGTITVYSGRNETLIAPLFEQFSEKTGIDVEVRYADSGALASQLLTEGDASPADVFVSQDAGALGALTKERLFTKLPKKSITAVPAGYRAADGTWVGTSGRVRVVIYNPTLAPKPPKTIDAVVDPKWKGKVGFAPTNASWQSFVTALRLLRGEVKAEKWLRAFAANEPKAYASNGAVRDAVDSGELALGLVNHYYLWERLAVEGEDALTARNQYMAPDDPGGLVNVAGVGIMKSSDNKRAAQAFVDYMLSDAGQTYFAESTYEYPLTKGVSPSVKLPPLDSLQPPAVDLSDLDTLAATQALLVKTGLLTR